MEVHISLVRQLQSPMREGRALSRPRRNEPTAVSFQPIRTRRSASLPYLTGFCNYLHQVAGTAFDRRPNPGLNML